MSDANRLNHSDVCQWERDAVNAAAQRDRDIAKLQARAHRPQSVAARLAPKPSFLARVFGGR